MELFNIMLYQKKSECVQGELSETKKIVVSIQIRGIKVQELVPFHLA